ncbi:hypothetical protein [Acaryochloris sp. IP29b_bin.137]|uniref:hypothetical protein n=1 Tax=Acaryochloris sp. IP29b_bin.137 TaxID=2969217 RepID=UPI002627FC8F|nr:hypothetical protein [Acaryochloris sp. IP29b_bin.137]
MTLRTHHWIAIVLGFSGIALGVLVPGGPIETRSFSHIDPITLGAFNTFLTSLVLGSLLLVYFVLKLERWAIIGTAVCGLSFLGVYGLDLAHIFPVSPDAMPPALLAIEILGTIVSLPLIVLTIQAFRGEGQEQLAATSSTPSTTLTFDLLQRFTVLGITLIGLAIIAFATRSAMGL